MKNVIRYIIVMLAMCAGFVLFALGASMLPNGPIQRSMEKTLQSGDLDSGMTFPFIRKSGSASDLGTECLILNQAISGGKQDIWNNIMTVPHRYKPDVEEPESIWNAVYPDEGVEKDTYSRYWHGTTFLMRIMLMFCSYSVIKLFFYVVSSLLIFWLCSAVARQRSSLAAFFLFFGMTICQVYLMLFSIQYLPVLAIGLMAALWVVYRVRSVSQLSMTLFVAGILTSFFDLLTCPLITWGLPICVWQMLPQCKQESDTWLSTIWHWASSSLLWVVGYFGSWVIKFVLATATTSQNVIQNGFSQILFRTETGENISRIGALISNFGHIPWYYFFVVMIVLVLICIKYHTFDKLKSVVTLLLTALVPIGWYFVCSNHSCIHSSFTYRSLMITITAILMAVYYLIDWQKAKQGLTNSKIANYFRSK